ncbi:hypothetical protein WJX74_001136 [Apatococcus lobatus]|uniref:Cytochrome P450 n=1 Tax=Apatococcus lobatus TaxID=904363 RepID=A0AAW1RZ53_9CHLO
MFGADPLKWSRERIARHGPVFQSHLLGQPIVIVGDLVNWQKALNAEFKSVAMNFPESFRKASGQTGTADKDTHAFQRKAISKAFEPEAMAGYLPFMEQILRRYLDLWASQSAGVDLVAAGRKLGFEFAAALVLGKELDEATRDSLSVHFSNVINSFFTIPVDLPFTPLGKAMASRKSIQDWICRHVLLDYLDYVKTGKIVGRRGIIHSFLDGANPPDAQSPAFAQKIADAVQGTIIAGNDTTSTGMISLLGMWPQFPQHVKDKLREEQDVVRSRFGEELSCKAMAAMPYALATVKEVMRILPTSSGVWRDALEDFELGGKLIRKGSSMMMLTHPAHASDPKLPASQFEVPEHMDLRNLEDCFRPERWLKDSTRPALAVWGMGPHTCQGMPLFYQEAKMLLAILTRSYTVQNVSGPFEWKLLPLPSPKSPVTLTIHAHCFKVTLLDTQPVLFTSAQACHIQRIAASVPAASGQAFLALPGWLRFHRALTSRVGVAADEFAGFGDFADYIDDDDDEVEQQYSAPSLSPKHPASTLPSKGKQDSWIAIELYSCMLAA